MYALGSSSRASFFKDFDKKRGCNLLSGKPGFYYTPFIRFYCGMSEQNSVPMTIASDNIRERIYTICGVQVVLDSETKALN